MHVCIRQGISTYSFTGFFIKDWMGPTKEAGIQGDDYWHHWAAVGSASPED